MTTKQTTRTGAAPKGRQADPTAMVSMWQSNALDLMSRAGQAYTSGVAAIGEEMASFMQTRLQQNIALGESLTRCHTLTDMANVQRDWMKETTEEYAAEARKLIELSSNLMRESWQPVEQAARESAGSQAEQPGEG